MKNTIITLLTVLFAINAVQAQKQLQPFQLKNNRLNISFDFYKGNQLRLRTITPLSYNFSTDNLSPMNEEADQEISLHLTGEDRNAHHGAKLTGGSAGSRLQYIDRVVTSTPTGSLVKIILYDSLKNLRVESFYEMISNTPVIRRYATITNEGKEAIGIEYMSAAMLNNFNNITKGKPDENLQLHYAFNSWKAEGQWQKLKPSRAGWVDNGEFNISGLFINNIGSWSSVKYLPMGLIENTTAGITWFWQIEHNGSWHWEVSDVPVINNRNSSYAYIGGPDEEHAHAWKNLQPGETYQTVPVALGCVKGNFDSAIAALTIYRRENCLRPHEDNKLSPVIFNDYMNCLWGNPTTEKELPLIDAAAKAGCDYFVIDAGWYAEKNENWWESVGLWLPSQSRFPGGLQQVLDYIKQKGMKPGLWLEIEVAGINSPLKDKPDSWFFMRHGKRVIDHGRYILDFRNSEVVAHANAVVKRLMNDYGITYIKMDYNINALMGTETGDESFGQGLLEHNRAVVKWHKNMHDEYPQLVMENCGSGGCRMDYAMLSQSQLQSSSDLTNYKKYPAVLVGAMAAVLPEQLAVWSYPAVNGNATEASFNMVNAMLCRIHQSGHLNKLTAASLQQVTTGIKVYKQMLSPNINKSVPFFPLGMPSIADTVSAVSVGLQTPAKKYIAVWRLSGKNTVTISNKRNKKAILVYPKDLGIAISNKNNQLIINFPQEYMAAIVEIAENQ